LESSLQSSLKVWAFPCLVTWMYLPSCTDVTGLTSTDQIARLLGYESSVVGDALDRPERQKPIERSRFSRGILLHSVLNSKSGTRCSSETTGRFMAKIIEFYVPNNFRKKATWWIPPEQHGKVIPFGSPQKKSA
jgi:hypothetical protein